MLVAGARFGIFLLTFRARGDASMEPALDRLPLVRSQAETAKKLFAAQNIRLARAARRARTTYLREGKLMHAHDGTSLVLTAYWLDPGSTLP
jgi:hypothetical protein